MELLTVLTPTYNRCKLLINAFNSLINQTDKDFRWLIVDDGSTDSTFKEVRKMINDAPFPVEYIKQENGGKHRALNTGIKKIKTELVIILDSDDILLPDAIKTIKEKWSESQHDDIAYLSFLRVYQNGSIIGDKYPKSGVVSSHIEMCINGNIKGDKAEVYKTSIVQKYPFPEIEGEKFISEGVVWNRIGKTYKAKYYNIGIYQTEYLEGGLTKSGSSLRLKNPIGSMLYANECLTKQYSFLIRLKHSLLFNLYKIAARKKYRRIELPSSNSPILTALMAPFGYIFYCLKCKEIGK